MYFCPVRQRDRDDVLRKQVQINLNSQDFPIEVIYHIEDFKAPPALKAVTGSPLTNSGKPELELPVAQYFLRTADIRPIFTY